jgi:predicted lipoprotein with Yx(FWY)xxD motif
MFLKSQKAFAFFLDFGLALMLVLAVLLAACQTTTTQSVTLPDLTQTSSVGIPITGGATVIVDQNDELGQILVDDLGMTLYTNKDDSPGHSNCVGECMTGWMPMLASSMPVAGEGVPGKLGVISRDDGALQVTYNGLPLYYSTKDTQPGDANGLSIDNEWSVVLL